MLKRLSPIIYISLILSACGPGLGSGVKFPAIISDNVVLQRGGDIRIWGWADPGEKVTVRFRGQGTGTTADAEKKWEVHLKPSRAGGPLQSHHIRQQHPYGEKRHGR